MLVVDTAVVVTRKVIVDVGHCDLGGNKASESVAVPLVVVEVEGSDSGEDDGKIVIVHRPDWCKSSVRSYFYCGSCRWDVGKLPVQAVVGRRRYVLPQRDDFKTTSHSWNRPT